jgi:hypothetical protein
MLNSRAAAGTNGGAAAVNVAADDKRSEESMQAWQLEAKNNMSMTAKNSYYFQPVILWSQKVLSKSTCSFDANNFERPSLYFLQKKQA